MTVFLHNFAEKEKITVSASLGQRCIIIGMKQHVSVIS
jgi:hypothetical protein